MRLVVVVTGKIDLFSTAPEQSIYINQDIQADSTIYLSVAVEGLFASHRFTVPSGCYLHSLLYRSVFQGLLFLPLGLVIFTAKLLPSIRPPKEDTGLIRISKAADFAFFFAQESYFVFLSKSLRGSIKTEGIRYLLLPLPPITGKDCLQKSLERYFLFWRYVYVYVYLIGHSPSGFFRTNANNDKLISNKHNYVKNPNWREADQLAIYKRSREVELGGTREQHQLAVRTGFEPATYGFQIRRSNHSATLPPRVIFETNY